MADSKITAARAKAEKAIYFMMDKLEAKVNGFNSSNYKAYFDTLSDKEFTAFMKRLANEEWFNLQFQMDFRDKKSTPDLDRLKKVADYYNIPLEEYVAYPYKNPNDLDNPVISATKVPVIYSLTRPLQQMLDKKQSYSSDTEHQNILSGQVSGSSKSSSFSNQQTIALNCSNQQNILKELLGPRSDDEASKQKMLNQIEETGDFDIDSIPIRTKDKQALETVRVFLVGAGLRVAYNNDKATYVLPKD